MAYELPVLLLLPLHSHPSQMDGWFSSSGLAFAIAFAFAFAFGFSSALFSALLFWAVSSRRAQQHKSTYFIGIYVLLWRRPALTPQPLAPNMCLTPHASCPIRPICRFSLFRCAQPDTFTQSNEVVLYSLSLLSHPFLIYFCFIGY